MKFNLFEQYFVPFCESPNVKSGKARSYYLAIKYLAEYLNVPDFGNGNAHKILEKENDINDSGSIFYRQLLKSLESQKRGSYLSKGYIKAALPYFRRFASGKNLL